MAYRCSKLNPYCLLNCWENSTLFLAFADQLWPCIKVKHIETSMSVYAMHKSRIMPKIECHSLNIVWDITIQQQKYLSRLRSSCDLEWRLRSSDWEKNLYIDLESDYLHSKQDGHSFNSFWNNRTCIWKQKELSLHSTWESSELETHQRTHLYTHTHTWTCGLSK